MSGLYIFEFRILSKENSMKTKETSHIQFTSGCYTQLKQSPDSPSDFFQALTCIMKILRSKHIVLKLLTVEIQIGVFTYISQ